MAGSPAEQIKDLLVTDGLGTFGTNLFVGLTPDGPDACVAVYDAGGAAPNPKWALDQPNVMIRVRGAKGDYAGAYAKARAVRDALVGRAPGGEIRGITGRGDVNHLGTDEGGRHILTVNCVVTMQPAAAGHRTAI